MSRYQYLQPCRELSGYVQYYWMLDLADLAFHAGYYDSAHLANEIKTLTGHTSGSLFQLMCFSEDADSISWFLES